MVEKTIINACLIANVDKKLISREKYQALLNTEGLPKVTEMITDEVDNIKKQSQAVAQQKEAELQHQKEEFEKKQKEAELQHQKELEAVKKQASQTALQMLNRYMDVIKSINPTFSFGEVKLVEKELSNPQTGSIDKYNVKEVN